MVIVSTAEAGQKKVANYIDETLRHWGFNKIYKITYAFGGKEEINTEEINKISQKFHKDVMSKKLHPPKLETSYSTMFGELWHRKAMP